MGDEELGAIARRCALGELPANIALMQLAARAARRGEVEDALGAALHEAEAAADRVRAAVELWRANPAAWDTVKAVFGRIDHSATSEDSGEAIARCASAFDAAARISPEASVALYSLGSADLLNAAAAEVAAFVQDSGLSGASKRCLDLGCGIGRMERVLASEFAEIVGVDISAEMIRLARQYCADLPNVHFVHTSGRDLAAVEDLGFDLVLAVDSFPYVMQAGLDLAEALVKEAARVLKPGGSFLILNFSYRGDAKADERGAAAFANRAGLVPAAVRTSTFRYWDGLAFRLEKPR